MCVGSIDVAGVQQIESSGGRGYSPVCLLCCPSNTREARCSNNNYSYRYIIVLFHLIIMKPLLPYSPICVGI